MSLMVDNCSRCGKVYQKNHYGICMDCRRREVGELESFFEFMKRNRKATMEEVCQITGVDSSQIIRFIQEGRIPMSDFVNLTYPCDTCGTPIREHKLCISCRSRIKRDIEKMIENEPIVGSKYVPPASLSPAPGTKKLGGYQIRK